MVDSDVGHDAKVVVLLYGFADDASEVVDLFFASLVEKPVHFAAVSLELLRGLLGRGVLLVGEEHSQVAEVDRLEGCAAEGVLRRVQLAKELGRLSRVVNVDHL